MTLANSLEKICADSRITESVAIRLRMQSEHLKCWRDEIRPTTLTEKDRVKSLKKICELAEKLKITIEALEFQDRMALDSEFFSPSDLLDENIPTRELDLGGFVVPKIGIAAFRAIERIQDSEKAGRKEISHRLADFIRCIASELKPAGIVPAHSGFFREICMAVFEDADVTYSDKAHRYFMAHVRPELKAAGYCL